MPDGEEDWLHKALIEVEGDAAALTVEVADAIAGNLEGLLDAAVHPRLRAGVLRYATVALRERVLRVEALAAPEGGLAFGRLLPCWRERLSECIARSGEESCAAVLTTAGLCACDASALNLHAAVLIALGVVLGDADRAKSQRELAANCLRTMLHNVAHRGGLPPEQSTAILQLMPVLTGVIREAGRDATTMQTAVDALCIVSQVTDRQAGGQPHDGLVDGVMASGIMADVIAVLKGAVGAPPASGAVARQHDYRQAMAHDVPHDVLYDVMAYMPATAVREKLVFVCKDWFYDVVCFHPLLYNRARNPLAEEEGLQMPALRACGNFMEGTDEHTDYVMGQGMVGYLGSVLAQPSRACQKEALWALSNTAAGTDEQLTAVLDDDDVMRHVATLAVEAVVNVAKEAVWVFANAGLGGSAGQRLQCVRQGALAAVLRSYADFPDKQRNTVGIGKELVAAIAADGAPLFGDVDAILQLFAEAPVLARHPSVEDAVACAAAYPDCPLALIATHGARLDFRQNDPDDELLLMACSDEVYGAIQRLRVSAD
jgi:hypothetical protein